MSKSKHWWGPNDDDNDHEHDSETASKKSGKSGISRKSSAAFFYPPLTPPATSAGPSAPSRHFAAAAAAAAAAEPLPPVPASVAGPPPLSRHPYQAYYSPSSYDYHSSSTPPITTSRGNSRSQLPYGTANASAGTAGNPLTVSMTDADGDRSFHNKNDNLNNSRNINNVTGSADAHTSVRGSTLALSSLQELKITRWVAVLLLFLPIPPLLSLIYLAIGHSILRAAHSAISSWSSHSLLSSVNAGATGGIILSLPLLLLFTLLFPSRLLRVFPMLPILASSRTDREQPSQGPRRRSRTANENFFDDRSSSDSINNRRRLQALLDIAKYTVAALIVLGMGSAAGAIGVACLADSQTGGLLAPGEAAEAAIVGALVFWPGLGLVTGIAVAAGMWGRKNVSSDNA